MRTVRVDFKLWWLQLGILAHLVRDVVFDNPQSVRPHVSILTTTTCTTHTQSHISKQTTMSKVTVSNHTTGTGPPSELASFPGPQLRKSDCFCVCCGPGNKATSELWWVVLKALNAVQIPQNIYTIFNIATGLLLLTL